MVPASSVLGESTHDRISPEGLMLRKPELEQRESREYRKFRRPFRISYEFKEKSERTSTSWSLCSWQSTDPIGREGRGREAVSTCSCWRTVKSCC